ncbi:MAG: hypothetical protein K6G28_02130 [Acholeplasmatales bacterium]|nr:hypothetical protein [Acholeplasmatales bacterium]
MSLENGKGEGDKNHKVVGSSLIASIVISIIFIAIVYPLLKPILTVLGLVLKNH